MSAPDTARRSARRSAATLLAVLCTLLLAACGARVDTVFTLDDGPTGSRVMTLTLSESDLDQYVNGGTAALEASIQRHKPDGLDYTGLVVADGSVTVTFALTFDSADTYRQKATAVLAAGGRTDEPTIVLSTEDSLFVRGAAIDEDFTSLDLLTWLADGLVADGTVAADQRGNILESGSTEVVYRGQSTSAYQPITFTEMTDNGVTSAEMTTWLFADHGYRRTVVLRMPTDAYDSDPDAFDAYLAAAVPDGGELTVLDQDGWTVGWSIDFTADDADRLAAMTDQVLGTEGTAFAVTEEPDPDNPTRRHTTVVDTAACDAICSPQATPLISTLVVPTGWETALTSADADAQLLDDGLWVTHRPTATPVEFDHAIPFEAVHVQTRIGFGRSVDQTITFDVTTENAEAAGDGFTQLLTPADDLGELTTTTGDGLTHYTVTITADSVADYNARITSFSPGAALTLHPTEGDGLWWSHYRVTLALDLAGSVANGGVTQPITYDTQVPFGHSISAEDSALDAGGSVAGRTASAVGAGGGDPTSSVAVSGPTLAVVILAGALAVIGLAAVAALVVFRRRVGAAIDAWTRHRAERAAARPAVATVPQPAAPAPGGTAPLPLWQPEGEFTEAELH